eukprot:gene12687-biopygen3449
MHNLRGANIVYLNSHTICVINTSHSMRSYYLQLGAARPAPSEYTRGERSQWHWTTGAEQEQTASRRIRTGLKTLVPLWKRVSQLHSGSVPPNIWIV